MSYIVEHSRGKKQLVVTSDYTASKWGSGLMDILATPAMIALAEATCMESVQGDLEKGMTTVGTKIDIEHLSPTSNGTSNRSSSRLTAGDLFLRSSSLTTKVLSAKACMSASSSMQKRSNKKRTRKMRSE